MSRELRSLLNDRLRSLLMELELTDQRLAEADIQVLQEAAPDDVDMQSVYSVLNEELLAAVRTSPMIITHITGEARVLVDPQHRNVIASNAERGGLCVVACRDRTERPIRTAEDFLAAQQGHWSILTWTDLIDILALAASGALSVDVMRIPAKVHFSLFGRDRILIQEPQRDATERKRLWYLKSQLIVRFLTQTADADLAGSIRIPAISFGALLRWLTSEQLAPLVRAEQVEPSFIDSLDDQALERLVAIGVLKRNGQSVLPALLPRLPRLQGGSSEEFTE